VLSAWERARNTKKLLQHQHQPIKNETPWHGLPARGAASPVWTIGRTPMPRWFSKRPGRFGGLAFSHLNSSVNFRFALIVTFAACTSVYAKDEKSINDLHNALIALSPRTVDPEEAAVLSETAHRMSRQLAREYGVDGDPAVHNFLINIGARKKGICADYTRDIGAKLKEFHFKTLVLHWGAAWARESEENNALIVTARNQPFMDGIVLDGWRRGGRLFWCKVREDGEYEAGRHGYLGHLGGSTRTGVTAWKEDLHETALLQSGATTNRK
jgi:hypothetical protein